MPKLPPHVIRVLRKDQRPEASAERLERIASSIEGAAAPLLAARRQPEPDWWETPAAWAGALIPMSLVLATASLLVLWRMQPPQPRDLGEVAQAVNELTAPPR